MCVHFNSSRDDKDLRAIYLLLATFFKMTKDHPGYQKEGFWAPFAQLQPRIDQLIRVQAPVIVDPNTMGSV